MYYVGFLKTDLRRMMLFWSDGKPTQQIYPYFGKVIGPYESEREARNAMKVGKVAYGYRENPATESRAQYCRERQLSPRMFAKRSFRTIALGASGKKGVIGCPEGEYKRGKCGVGTRLQTILHPVGSRGCPKGGLELKKRKRNPVGVMSHRKALTLTKKIIAYAKRLMKHERAGVRENPGVEYHKQKFIYYMKELEKYRIASKRYIEVLAKAYEHLQSMEDSK